MCYVMLCNREFAVFKNILCEETRKEIQHVLKNGYLLCILISCLNYCE